MSWFVIMNYIVQCVRGAATACRAIVQCDCGITECASSGKQYIHSLQGCFAEISKGDLRIMDCVCCWLSMKLDVCELAVALNL